MTTWLRNYGMADIIDVGSQGYMETDKTDLDLIQYRQGKGFPRN